MRRWHAAACIASALILVGCVTPNETPTAVETPKTGVQGALATAPPPTEACLSLPGGSITPVNGFTGDGDNTWPKLFPLQSNNKLDARNAKFLVHDPMTDQNRDGFFGIVLLRSSSGTDNNGCWSGGEILGDYAPSTLWASWHNASTGMLDHGMHDKYGMLLGDQGFASGLRIDSVFIFDYGDGISFDNVTDYATTNDFTIRKVHIKYSRDDCIEDDSYLGGTIDEAFLDGCYSGVSAQASPE